MKFFTYTIMISLLLISSANANKGTICYSPNIFIDRLYTVLLDREPSQNENNNWSAPLLNHTYLGEDVIRGFVFSPEFMNTNRSHRKFVSQLYQAILNRQPDKAGIDFWVNHLNTGMSQEDVLDAFIYSNEFMFLAAKHRFRASYRAAYIKLNCSEILK